MAFNLPLYPAVNLATTSSRMRVFRGSTFGQSGMFHVLSEADKEVAENYDLKQVRERAIQARKQAGLPLPDQS